jgi:chromosome segregation ATPase
MISPLLQDKVASLESLLQEKEQVDDERAGIEHRFEVMSGEWQRSVAELEASIVDLEQQGRVREAEMSDAVRQREALSETISGLEQERETLSETVCSLEHERDNLSASLEASTQWRDDLAAALSDAHCERDALSSSLDEARCERDAVLAALSGAEGFASRLSPLLEEACLRAGELRRQRDCGVEECWQQEVCCPTSPKPMRISRLKGCIHSKILTQCSTKISTESRHEPKVLRKRPTQRKLPGARCVYVV